LIDMPLSPLLAAWLRDHGHDTVHAADLGLDRAPDEDLLEIAKRNNRTIITADLDYPRLLALAQMTAPGVLLFRDGDWTNTEVMARLTEILDALPATEIAQSIIVVDRDRVRRRRLPIAR
jgi:predicted nuclease of predicted toxin-antitoxin system